MDTTIGQTAPSVAPDGERVFAAIITAHESALLRYVARLVNDVHTAQDVVQETFLKLFRKWRADTCPTENLRPWLYRVAHNAAIDHLRRESRLRRLHEQEALERSASAPADSQDPPERIQIIMGHLRRLDPAEQQVVLLRMQEGLSYREISLVTGRTEGNIGCLLHHAVKKISASLKQAGLISNGGLP